MKSHSTMSRRDFMKTLGLGATAIGSVGVTAPIFHDLDEMMSISAAETFNSTTSMQKRPWFVKEVDIPTVEIDLKLRTPYAGPDPATGTMASIYVTKEETAAILASQQNNAIEGAKNNRPGFTLRDQIGAWASLDRGQTGYVKYPPEGFRTIKVTHETLGVPKWEGSETENAFMIRTFLRQFGAGAIGYARVDDDSVGPRKPLFNTHVRLENNPDYKYDANGTFVMPEKCKYAIIIYDRSPRDPNNYRRTVNSPQAFVSNMEKCEYGHKLQNFLWGLGYQSYWFEDSTTSKFTGTPTNVWGILSGIGEYNRIHNTVSQPEGESGNFASILFTDLPLPTTKPIDFGALEFCKTCGICADVCPSGAIPTVEEYREPTWDRATGPWSASNDHKGYPNKSIECVKWYFSNAVTAFAPSSRPVGVCRRCSSHCVFSKDRKAWIHEVVKSVVSTTPVMNSFFTKMDTLSGYSDVISDEGRAEYWHQYLPAV
ncbi:MAG: reductive dehalogenase [Dehalococcoides mccartyi]|uniref:reductive dehalogenase n=1 Tax=Dehalococcoides mccartyi TaxID=61435 RepID=UPI0030F66A1C